MRRTDTRGGVVVALRRDTDAWELMRASVVSRTSATQADVCWVDSRWRRKSNGWEFPFRLAGVYLPPEDSRGQVCNAQECRGAGSGLPCRRVHVQLAVAKLAAELRWDTDCNRWSVAIGDWNSRVESSAPRPGGGPPIRYRRRQDVNRTLTAHRLAVLNGAGRWSDGATHERGGQLDLVVAARSVREALVAAGVPDGVRRSDWIADHAPVGVRFRAAVVATRPPRRRQRSTAGGARAGAEPGAAREQVRVTREPDVRFRRFGLRDVDAGRLRQAVLASAALAAPASLRAPVAIENAMRLELHAQGLTDSTRATIERWLPGLSWTRSDGELMTEIREYVGRCTADAARCRARQRSDDAWRLVGTPVPETRPEMTQLQWDDECRGRAEAAHGRYTAMRNEDVQLQRSQIRRRRAMVARRVDDGEPSRQASLLLGGDAAGDGRGAGRGVAARAGGARTASDALRFFGAGEGEARSGDPEQAFDHRELARLRRNEACRRTTLQAAWTGPGGPRRGDVDVDDAEPCADELRRVNARANAEVAADEVRQALRKMDRTSAADGAPVVAYAALALTPTQIVRLRAVAAGGGEAAANALGVLEAEQATMEHLAAMVDAALFPPDPDQPISQILTRFRMTPVHKGGGVDDIGDFRRLGTCSVLARLVQSVAAARASCALEALSADANAAAAGLGLDSLQAGFRRRYGTWMHIIISGLVMDAADRTRACVAVLYLDIAKAFPTTDALLLNDRMYRAGLRGCLPAALLRLNREARCYFRIGVQVTEAIGTSLGMVEGSVHAPTAFAVASRSMTDEATSLRDWARRNLESRQLPAWAGDGVLMPLYADDARLILVAHDAATLLRLLRRACEQLGVWQRTSGYRLNVKLGAMKTMLALCVRGGGEGAQDLERQLVGDGEQPATEPLAIDVGAERRAVPVAADGYRSLGVYESPKGTRATQDTHVRKRVTAACNLALCGLRWVRLDLVPPAVGVQAIVSHVLPAPMYAAGAWCVKAVPDCIVTMLAGVVRSVAGGLRRHDTSSFALRLALGLRSVPEMVRRERVWMLSELMDRCPSQLHRRTLRETVAATRAARRRLPSWWQAVRGDVQEVFADADLGDGAADYRPDESKARASWRRRETESQDSARLTAAVDVPAAGRGRWTQGDQDLWRSEELRLVQRDRLESMRRDGWMSELLAALAEPMETDASWAPGAECWRFRRTVPLGTLFPLFRGARTRAMTLRALALRGAPGLVRSLPTSDEGLFVHASRRQLASADACTACGAPGGFSLAHLVLDCERYAREREVALRRVAHVLDAAATRAAAPGSGVGGRGVPWGAMTAGESLGELRAGAACARREWLSLVLGWPSPLRFVPDAVWIGGGPARGRAARQTVADALSASEPLVLAAFEAVRAL